MLSCVCPLLLAVACFLGVGSKETYPLLVDCLSRALRPRHGTGAPPIIIRKPTRVASPRRGAKFAQCSLINLLEPVAELTACAAATSHKCVAAVDEALRVQQCTFTFQKSEDLVKGAVKLESSVLRPHRAWPVAPMHWLEPTRRYAHLSLEALFMLGW